MIDVTTLQLESWIGAFFWPFLRVLGVLAVAPLFGATEIPVQVRVGLAVVIAVALAPALGTMPPVDLGSALGLTLVVQQLLVGLVIGMSMALVLSTVQIAGSIIGLQMGLSFSTLFDPVQGVEVTSLASFLNMLTVLLFVALNGHLMLLGVLARSFTLVPVGPHLGLAAASWRDLALEGSALFSLGLALSAPALGVVLIANIGLGVLTRLAPQLNMFAIGFALFFALGFFALYLLLPMLQVIVRHLVEMGLELSTRLLAAQAG